MNALTRLQDALCCLPGVGPKSAWRMILSLLQESRDKGLHLASCLEDAMRHVRHCDHCNNYTLTPLCTLCTDETRDASILCIVETPTDVSAIEQSNSFKGHYFVLMKKISPIDGIGPEEIGLPRLKQRINHGTIAEVIIALSPSIEGQPTIHFIREALQSSPVRVSQLASGIPASGDIEYLDSYTIASAFRNRD